MVSLFQVLSSSAHEVPIRGALVPCEGQGVEALRTHMLTKKLCIGAHQLGQHLVLIPAEMRKADLGLVGVLWGALQLPPEEGLCADSVQWWFWHFALGHAYGNGNDGLVRNGHIQLGYRGISDRRFMTDENPPCLGMGA